VLDSNLNSWPQCQCLFASFGLYKSGTIAASALFYARLWTSRRKQSCRITHRTSAYLPRYLQHKVMPQRFSARAATFPSIEITDSDNLTDTFWLRAQNLTRYDPPLPSTFSTANRDKLCGFCQACFDGLLETGDTKRIDHRSELQALLRSAIYCPLCSFFKTIVSPRCGESIFRDGHEFTVYTHKSSAKQPGAQSLLNVGFQIKNRCMGAMAFCPDSSK
jgi:hypothetical protein